MRTVIIVFAAVVLGCAIQYTLYINGYLIVKSIMALVFRGSARRWWKGRPAARVVACSGWVRKVIRFKESREYQFTFVSNVSKGSITTEVQNRKKETILKLDSENNHGFLAVDNRERYYLVVKFQKATGDFELTWS